MKSTFLSIIFLLSSTFVTLAQNSGKLQSADSVRVEVERSAISKELVQLRDSINQSLKLFDSRIKKATAEKKVALETAKEELVEYRNRVKSDLDETSLTAVNAWTSESVNRIRTNTEATRKEYHRIKKMITG